MMKKDFTVNIETKEDFLKNMSLKYPGDHLKKMKVSGLYFILNEKNQIGWVNYSDDIFSSLVEEAEKDKKGRYVKHGYVPCAEDEWEGRFNEFLRLYKQYKRP